MAFAARAGFLWVQQRSIPHEVLGSLPFAQETGNIAFALSDGQGFSNVFRQSTGPTAWLPPVYPFVVSLIFRAFGAFTFHAFFAAAFFNILCSAATSVPIYLIGKRLAGVPCAGLAAWLWALYPHAILMPVEWMWETSLSALMVAALLLFTVRLGDEIQVSNFRSWSLYGALWGFGLLTNPAIGAGLPFLFGWVLLRNRRKVRRVTADEKGLAVPSKAWKFAVLSLGVTILCCLPWTIRNFAAFHRLIPLRSNFAFELWLGNNDIFDREAVNGTQRITRFGQARLYAQQGETQFMEEKWRMAMGFIRARPGLCLRLTARRVVATWLGTENPWNDFRSTDSWQVRGIFASNLLVFLGAGVGLITLFVRRHPLAFALAVFPLAFPVVYYITHTSLRYRHPIDPVLILLLAVSVLAACRAKCLDRAAG